MAQIDSQWLKQELFDKQNEIVREKREILNKVGALNDEGKSIRTDWYNNNWWNTEIHKTLMRLEVSRLTILMVLKIILEYESQTKIPSSSLDAEVEAGK